MKVRALWLPWSEISYGSHYWVSTYITYTAEHECLATWYRFSLNRAIKRCLVGQRWWWTLIPVLGGGGWWSVASLVVGGWWRRRCWCVVTGEVGRNRFGLGEIFEKGIKGRKRVGFEYVLTWPIAPPYNWPVFDLRIFNTRPVPIHSNPPICHL